MFETETPERVPEPDPGVRPEHDYPEPPEPEQPTPVIDPDEGGDDVGPDTEPEPTEP
jgi:hypothetical protein